ncbi:MAG: hypothetical protein NPINA01_00010 [Nitrospinaceae bacterium]|nr:MAG: hypothetical protein NPINA01_00010 [Nitrospinaceae bacterium]
MKIKYLGLIVLLLVGCAQSSGVLKIGPDTYTVSVDVHPARGGEPEARRRALTEANQYCSGIKKEILVSDIASSQSIHSSGGIVQVMFACLNQGDKALQRPEYKKNASGITNLKN